MSTIGYIIIEWNPNPRVMGLSFNTEIEEARKLKDGYEDIRPLVSKKTYSIGVVTPLPSETVTEDLGTFDGFPIGCTTRGVK